MHASMPLGALLVMAGGLVLTLFSATGPRVIPRVQAPVLSPAELETRLSADVQLELRSDDPARIAWGARHAAQFRLEGLQSEVARVLDTQAILPPSTERVFVVWNALDAAIQTGMRPERTALTRWTKAFDFADRELVILSAQDPFAYLEPLLELLDRARASNDFDTWRCACNVLASKRPARLLEALLPELTIPVTIIVDDGDPTSTKIATRIGFTDENRDPLVGGNFPPSLGYSIVTTALPGGIVITPGLEPAYYRRGKESVTLTPKSADAYRVYAFATIDWIARSRTTSITPWAPTYLFVPWNEGVSFESRVKSSLDKLQMAWDSIRDELQQSGIAEARELGEFSARLDLRFEDRRKNKSMPLPPITR